MISIIVKPNKYGFEIMRVIIDYRITELNLKEGAEK